MVGESEGIIDCCITFSLMKKNMVAMHLKNSINARKNMANGTNTYQRNFSNMNSFFILQLMLWIGLKLLDNPLRELLAVMVAAHETGAKISQVTLQLLVFVI